MHCTDDIKTHYVQMLVIIKKILTKMYFCTPPTFGPPFTLLTHNIQTSFLAQI